MVIQVERIHYSVARNEAGSGSGGLTFHDQRKLLSNSPYHLLMSTLLRSEMSRGRWFFSWCRLPPRSRGRASPDPTTFAAMATSDNEVEQYADVACRLQSSLVPLTVVRESSANGAELPWWCRSSEGQLDRCVRARPLKPNGENLVEEGGLRSLPSTAGGGADRAGTLACRRVM